jgi:DNA repair protein RecO (recombination protein O)
MPVYKANAIVLRRINLGETDKILTLLCRETGKLSAVAKGARRGTSKLSGATELFTYSRLLLAVGKSLDIVSQCEIKESFPQLRTDLSRLTRATYLCELTDRLVEEREPNPEVFDLLLSALYLLQRAEDNADVIVHAFELHLLAERGYTPQLDVCVKCGDGLPRGRTGFSPSLGGTLCGADRYSSDDAIAVSHETLELMRKLLSAEPEEMIMLHPPVVVLREVARCLRWYIRYRSERDLKSAEFLDMLRMTAEKP